MATTFFLHAAASDLGGAGQKALDTTRGAAAATAVTNTVASGNNIQITQTAGGQALQWLTAPLSAVTISGSITVNIRGLESATAANSGAGIRIERADSSGNILATIVPSSAVSATEYGTTDAARSAAFTPSPATLSTGDRIVVTVLAVAVGTMGGSRTVTNSYDGPTSGAAGDTFVTFTETITTAVNVPAGLAAGSGAAGAAANVRAAAAAAGGSGAALAPAVTVPSQAFAAVAAATSASTPVNAGTTVTFTAAPAAATGAAAGAAAVLGSVAAAQPAVATASSAFAVAADLAFARFAAATGIALSSAPQIAPARSPDSPVTDPRDGTPSVTARATSMSGVS